MIGVVVRRMRGRWGVVTPASLFAAGAVCWCFAIVYRMFFFGNSALDMAGKILPTGGKAAEIYGL